MPDIRISGAPLQTLERIAAFRGEHGRAPRPIELCNGRASRRGAILRSLALLSKAGLLARKGDSWAATEVTQAGHDRLSEVKGPIIIGSRTSTHYHVEGHAIRLTPRQREALYLIAQHWTEKGKFLDPNGACRFKTGRKGVTNRERGHMIGAYLGLEKSGLILRGGGRGWKKYGSLTERGVRIFQQLTKPQSLLQPPVPVRTGGGVDLDGGTRFKEMLFPVDSPDAPNIQYPNVYSKIGAVVKKALPEGRQMGLRTATISLEEGRTCDPNCGLIEACYAGKMSSHKRILYEGEKTDRAVAKAICLAEPLHYRLHVTGDFPSGEYLEGVFASIATTGSTAFGYTHWQPEHPLGAMIRQLSDWHWSFFSLRTSYEHGSRPPLLERAAVVVKSFDPEVLALHNAIPCPEELGKVSNCGECGLCWTTRRTIAFKEH